MKRRLIGIALCLAMLCTAIMTASCGNEDDMSDVGEDKVASAMTLTIWGIKEKGTTDEAIAEVEAAMSRITEAQFNTAVKLMLFTESEYDKALEKKMDEIQERLDAEAAEAEAKKAAEKEARKNGGADTTTAEETSAEESSDTADETVLDEYGLPTTLYPEVEDNQLDIFLMTDYKMFQKYSEKGVLSGLDEQLSSSSKLLKSYINPSLLAAGKVGKTTYAIVNNQMVGEYTFMILNKAMMDKYYYDPDDFSSLADAQEFLEVVGKNESVTPYAGIREPLNINYFTSDGSKSVVGYMASPDAVGGANGAPTVLFSNRNWTTFIKLMKELESNSWLGTETPKATDNFAVGIVKGEWTDVADFEENYYVKVLMNPQGTTENMYNGMFAVSTYTKSVARSMEILTYLNTRSDLRNLFGYGVEGVHYELDKDGVVKKLSNDYNMKLEYTGNTFIAYPPEGSSADIWEVAKLHNLDLVLSPWYGFSFDEAQIDPDVRKGVKSFSDSFYSELSSKSYDELEDWLTEKWDEADANESIQAFIATEVAADETADDAKTDDTKTDDTETDEKVVEILPMGKIYADWFSAAYPGG